VNNFVLQCIKLEFGIWYLVFAINEGGAANAVYGLKALMV